MSHEHAVVQQTMRTETTSLVTPFDYYDMLTAASVAWIKAHVLNHGDTFAVFGNQEDITHAGNGEQGLYYEGTLSTPQWSCS